MRPTHIPPPRPPRETPTYQTPTPATPTTINHTARTVVTTLGQTSNYSTGRRGRCLPFWLNKERRATDTKKLIDNPPVQEEKLWGLEEEEDKEDIQ